MLLDIAEESIRSAFGRRPPTLPDDLPAVLHECRGAFVTLHVAGALNGCIGAIVADEPLAPTVARLARSAAFDDPRLPATTPADLAHPSIDASVLSRRCPPVPGRSSGPACSRGSTVSCSPPAATGACSCPMCGPSSPTSTTSWATSS
ncbi:MAG TPA: AMMECR1 domain-containing protein [Acidimicrobiales bacterium]|nr:AMMECR1 domain-containing protein [Acidimicrobiales bacterium]